MTSINYVASLTSGTTCCALLSVQGYSVRLFSEAHLSGHQFLSHDNVTTFRIIPGLENAVQSLQVGSACKSVWLVFYPLSALPMFRTFHIDPCLDPYFTRYTIAAAKVVAYMVAALVQSSAPAFPAGLANNAAMGPQM